MPGEVESNLHFVPIPYSGPLQSDYLPSELRAEDYPSLIPPGGRVDTVAVPAILAAYNWAPKTERYRNRVAAFRENILRPPEVAAAAAVPSEVEGSRC